VLPVVISLSALCGIMGTVGGLARAASSRCAIGLIPGRHWKVPCSTCLKAGVWILALKKMLRRGG